MRVVLIALAVLGVGWDFVWWAAGAGPIGPARLKRMLEEPGGSAPLLIDVRTAAEFRLFHVEGAQSYPHLLSDPSPLDSVDRDRPLVVVCLSGHRSPVVAYRLKREGFKKVYYLSWGMLAWMVSGGRVVK